MKFIKGITFASFAKRGSLGRAETLKSLENMKERTGADFIILVPNAVQDTPQSENIDFTSEATMSDSELAGFIKTARDMGLRVALKPTVNCRNGTWRAHINFFDRDVPCEPKWSGWFKSYTDFQLHFAEIAQRCECEMFLPGCEMVQSERREDEWRRLIEELRGVYGGAVSYNTDKYQEDNVKWWDAVDVISSSGYYPIDDWERQLDRIEGVVKKFGKPFFFAECGCMSTAGAKLVPNDWSVTGDVDLEGQADWYRTMFAACSKREWVRGFALWDWSGRQYPMRTAASHKGYEIYGKPAERVVSEFYANAK
ncbi:MAG: 1,4-beta-xylanase [Oscillospiraceae bacterium]|nr:1,4-beta-xylanase [Oscillospiraceae bacterium]